MPGSSLKVISGWSLVGVAADQIGPLVAVHAHAVSEAMGEVLVIGAVACVGDDFARGGVDGAGFRAGLGGGQRGALGAMHNVEDLLHLVAGFAEHKGARDVGRVAFHRAAAVDHHDRAFANFLRCDRAVRESGKLANLYIGSAFESQLRCAASSIPRHPAASCPLSSNDKSLRRRRA
jgi:hypothetical protein